MVAGCPVARAFAVLAAFALAVVGCTGDEPALQPVPAEDLLAPEEFMQENWPSDGWQPYRTSDLTYRSADAVRRTWASRGLADYLEQEIGTFERVSDAQEFFNTKDPRLYDEDYPLQVDVSDEYVTNLADDYRMYCLGQEGSRAACSAWTYWARYGPYVLRFDYLAGLTFDDTDTGVRHEGMSLGQFIDFVTVIDRFVAEHAVSATVISETSITQF